MLLLLLFFHLGNTCYMGNQICCGNHIMMFVPVRGAEINGGKFMNIALKTTISQLSAFIFSSFSSPVL